MRLLSALFIALFILASCEVEPTQSRIRDGAVIVTTDNEEIECETAKQIDTGWECFNRDKNGHLRVDRWFADGTIKEVRNN